MFRSPPTARTTVLITGAAGFVGSALTRRLTADGHRVRGLDLPSVTCPTADTVVHDLTAPLPDGVLADVDLVIHCAALAGVQPSWRRPLDYWRANVLATSVLRAACERAGAPRVVAISSISVYGAGARRDERAPQRPLSPYGRTKLEAERVWSGYPDVTIARLSNVYGPGQRTDMAYATFIRAAVAGRPIELRDGGLQLRTPTYIADCVDGVIAVAADGKAGRAYNIAGPEDVRLRTVALRLERLLQVPVHVNRVDPAPGDPRVATVSIARARTELSFSPSVGLSEGLGRQLDSALPADAALAATG